MLGFTSIVSSSLIIKYKHDDHCSNFCNYQQTNSFFVSRQKASILATEVQSIKSYICLSYMRNVLLDLIIAVCQTAQQKSTFCRHVPNLMQMPADKSRFGTLQMFQAWIKASNTYFLQENESKFYCYVLFTQHVHYVSRNKLDIWFLPCPWQRCDVVWSWRQYVCPSTCVSQKPHAKIFCILPVAQSYSDRSAIGYVLPVLWITSRFHVKCRE